jgi:hypothetical protein
MNAGILAQHSKGAIAGASVSANTQAQGQYRGVIFRNADGAEAEEAVHGICCETASKHR